MRDLSPIEWAIRPLKKYAVFSGRAPRAEYWWYSVAYGIFGLALGFVDERVGSPIIGVYGPLSLILTLGLLVPGLTVFVRRLHDIGRSGWWVLLNLWNYVLIVASFGNANIEGLFKNVNPAITLVLVLLMLVCIVTMLVFAITRGTEGLNAYGPDPYGPDQLEEVFA
jgi:uncharacterized membrane protein YhaH (DUF805 family)